MSELKATTVYDAYWKANSVGEGGIQMNTELTTPVKIEIPGIGTIESADLYLKSEVDKVIADLEASHRKEVEQLKMKIAGLEKLVETADKALKQKGGFTIKDATFNVVRLEGLPSEQEGEKDA